MAPLPLIRRHDARPPAAHLLSTSRSENWGDWRSAIPHFSTQNPFQINKNTLSNSTGLTPALHSPLSHTREISKSSETLECVGSQSARWSSRAGEERKLDLIARASAVFVACRGGPSRVRRMRGLHAKPTTIHIACGERNRRVQYASEHADARNRLEAMELRTLGAQEPAVPSNSWLPIRDKRLSTGRVERRGVAR